MVEGVRKKKEGGENLGMINTKEWAGCSISNLVPVAEARERWHALITDASIATHQRPKIGVTG